MTVRSNDPMEEDMAPRSRHGRRRCHDDGGAVIVEMAIVLPLLFLIIFGIIEFGWTFYQLNDVRNGARETARLAAVNYKETDVSGTDQTDEIVEEVCGRMEEGDIDLAITLLGQDVGDSVTVTVQREYHALTGFLTSIYDPNSIDSTVEMRLEQDADYANEPNDTDFEDC